MSGGTKGQREVIVTLDGLPRPAALVGRHGEGADERVLVRFRQAGGFEERWVPAADVLAVEEGPPPPPLRKLVGLGLVGLVGLALLLYPSGSDQPLLSDDPTPGPSVTGSPTPSAAPSATPSTTPSATRSATSAVLLGDSLTAGRGVSSGTPTALEVAARELGWRSVTRARRLTGFTTAPSYAERLATEVTTAPDVLVLQGGASDTGATEAELRRAAGSTLASLQRRYPQTRLVLVGPVAMEQPPDQSLVRVDRVLRAVAQQQRVTYVSPIALRWITPENHQRYLSATGFYPDAEGHDYLGRKLADLLRTAP